jgi:hypothetical protein
VRGFLDRCWRLVVDERADGITLAPQVCADAPTDDQLREISRTVDKVTKDIQALSFNTAIARMMEFVNFCTPLERRPRAILEPFVTVNSGRFSAGPPRCRWPPGQPSKRSGSRTTRSKSRCKSRGSSAAE